MKILTCAPRLASKRIALFLALGLGGHALHAVAADVVVENANDSGTGSFRNAITNANSGDVIVFDIPGATPTINLLSDLPSISGDVSFRNENMITVFIDRNGQNAWQLDGGVSNLSGLYFQDGGVPSTDADITTSSSTTLFGNGTFTGNLTTPGTISPGDAATAGSFGTFGVTGNLDASNAKINLDIESQAGSTQNDLVNVTGTATVTGATLRPTFTGDDFSIGQTITVLSAGTLSGTITVDPATSSFANQPFLEAIENPSPSANEIGFLIQDNGLSFATVTSGCNQTSAASFMDDANAGSVSSVQTLRNGTSSEVSMAIAQLSGSIYPSLIGAEINHIQNNLESVRDRVALQPLGPRTEPQAVFWTRGYGMSGQVDRDDCQTAGYRQEVGGLELGAGMRGTNGWSVYSFAHLSGGEINSREVQQHAEIESYRGGGLVEYLGQTFYAIVSGGAGTQSYDVRRSLDAFSSSAYAESSFDGSAQFGYFELGKVLGNRQTVWVPHFGLHATRVELDPISESGNSDLLLSTGGGEGDALRSVLGLSVNQSGGTPLGRATTRIRFGWMHEYLDEFETFRSQLVSGAVPNAVLEDQGVAAGRDWAVLRLQVDMGVLLGGQLTTAYLGQYNSRASLNSGLAGLEWTY
ncbi:serine protease [Rhodopirellula sp. SM50]|nr:autotransporter outer membrane beta-barrel domain-containing protein [Rhodopirellula sp. SM50]PAY18498.1 serine protease [Rhodopirellula sp. SM50]